MEIQMDVDMDDDEGFSFKNAIVSEMKFPAYTHVESYEGPPLNYVTEKLQASLLAIFRTYKCLNYDGHLLYKVSDECKERLKGDLESSLSYGLIALMSLNNQLDNLNHLFDDILNSDEESFENWMERLWSDGSLNKNS